MLAAITNQFSAALKSQWASQLEFCTALNVKALEGMTKLIDLNLQTAQDALTNTATAMTQALSSEHPTVSERIGPNLLQARIDRALEYGRHATNIVSTTQTECTRIVQERMLEANRQVAAWLDDVVHQAPEGAGGAVEFLKAAFGNAGNGYEQWMKASEQAMGIMTASLDDLAHHSESAHAKPAKRARAH